MIKDYFGGVMFEVLTLVSSLAASVFIGITVSMYGNLRDVKEESKRRLFLLEERIARLEHRSNQLKPWSSFKPKNP